MLDLELFIGYSSLFAVIGLYPIIKILTNSELNPIEEKLKLILVFMICLFLFRIPLNLFHLHFFGRFVYISAILLAFSIFLFFETLLRRHMHLWTKLYAVAGCSIFILYFIFAQINFRGIEMILFAFFTLSLQFLVLIACIFRNKNEYNHAENKLINQCCWILFIYVPFFLSDIRLFYDFFKIPHLGVVGTLLFVFSIFNDENIWLKKSVLISKIFSTVLYALFCTFTIRAITPLNNFDIIAHTFVFFMICILVIRIHFMAQNLNIRNAQLLFIKEVAESDKSSISAYLKDIDQTFLNVHKKILTKSYFENYDFEKILSFFKSKCTLGYSLWQLQSELESIENAIPQDHKLIIEQLIDILEKEEMNHILNIEGQSSLFVVYNVSSFGHQKIIELKSSLVSEIAKLIKY